MSPRPAGKPAEAQQAKHALKSMAASLKRAYDEGRLRERSPAPNAPFGELRHRCLLSPRTQYSRCCDEPSQTALHHPALHCLPLQRLALQRLPLH